MLKMDKPDVVGALQGGADQSAPVRSRSADTLPMESWHSYPSIYNLGHRAIETLLNEPVYVEEKIDGSQFSFGVDFEGQLRVRSKGAVMHVDAPEKMFKLAVATAQHLKPDLVCGWTYR